MAIPTLAKNKSIFFKATSTCPPSSSHSDFAYAKELSNSSPSSTHSLMTSFHSSIEWRLIKWALLSRVWFLTIAMVSRLCSHDWVASSNLLFESPQSFVHNKLFTPSYPVLGFLPRALVRWDAAHFLKIAQDNLLYLDEHQAAFFPLVPWVMRKATDYLGPYVFKPDVPDGIQLAIFGILFSNICFVISTIFLYRLAYQLLKEQDLAFMTSIFYCFQPGSIFLSSIYTEAPFCLFSFSGMLFFERRRWFKATVMWAACGFLRSNGFLHAGFFVYHFIFHKAHKRFVFYCALLFLPFFAFEYYIYKLYCSTPSETCVWCNSLFGLSYSHLQKKYWNVGLFEYWRLEKLPDISVSIPVYIRSFQQIIHHFIHLRTPRNPILPYIVLHLFLCLSAIFIFHAQIVIRMFSSMPPLFLITHPKEAKGWWLWYTLLQSTVGAVMFSAFFGPP